MLLHPASVLVLASCLLVPGGDGPVPDVGITGVVEPVPGPTTCLQGTHQLACTGVLLQSDAVDLDALVGQDVKLLGSDVGVECVVLDVAAAGVPPATLEMCGTPSGGCPIRIKVCPGGLSQYWLFVSPTSGYLPLAPERGTWLLGEPSFLVAQGFGAGTCHQLDLTMPVTPLLVGAPLWMQAGRREVGPIGPISLTNAICVIIYPVGGVPCVVPDC